MRIIRVQKLFAKRPCTFYDFLATVIHNSLLSPLDIN